MGKISFSQRPCRQGEWTNFAWRSDAHCIVADRLPASLSCAEVEQTLRRYTEIESLRRIGENDDGTWAAKATCFTRKRARQLVSMLKRDKLFGPNAYPRVLKRAATVHTSTGDKDAINVLQTMHCASLLNSGLGFDRWSSTILALRSAAPVSSAPPVSARLPAARPSLSSSSSTVVQRLPPQAGSGAMSSSLQKPVQAHTVVGSNESALRSAPSVIGSRSSSSNPEPLPHGTEELLDEGGDWDHSFWDFHGRDGAGNEEKEAAPVSAAQLGLIAIVNAVFSNLPPDTYDGPTVGGISRHVGARGDFDIDDRLAEESGLVFAEGPDGGSGSSSDPDSRMFGPGSVFIKQSMWVERDPSAPVGAVTRYPAKPYSRRGYPTRLHPRKGYPDPTRWSAPGCCLHATVELRWTNPDGNTFTRVGEGGCGCDACASGQGKGYVASTGPRFAGEPGGDFTGVVAEAASGRVLTALELRTLSDKLTAELGNEPVSTRTPAPGGPWSHAASSSSWGGQQAQGYAVLRDLQSTAHEPRTPVLPSAGASFSALGPGGVSSGHSAQGLFSSKWAQQAFDRQAVLEHAAPSKVAVNDAIRDACAGVRLWVPS